MQIVGGDPPDAWCDGNFHHWKNSAETKSSGHVFVLSGLDFLSHFQELRLESISKTCSIAIMVLFPWYSNSFLMGFLRKFPFATKIHQLQMLLLSWGPCLPLARRGCSSLSPSMLGAPRDGFLPWNFGCLDDFSMTYASNWGLKKMGCGCNSQWIFLILSKDHPPDDSWCLPCAIVMVPWFYFETFWISLNREAHIQPFKCGMTIL